MTKKRVPHPNSLANLKPIRPGEVRNPHGGPKIPEDIKRARLLNTNTIARLYNELIHLSVPAIKERKTRPDLSVLEIWVLNVMSKGANDGNPVTLEMIISRIAGKITDKVEVALPKPTTVRLLNNEGTIVMGYPESKEDEDSE